MNNPIQISVIAITLGLALMVAWSTQAVIETSITAPGVVVPIGEVRKIQHVEGGSVSAILVSEGQKVAVGDVIARIDPVQAQSAAGSGGAKIDGLESQILRLNTEADGNRELAVGASASDAMKSEAKVFREDWAALDGKLSALDSQLAEALATAASKRETLKGLKIQETGQARIVATYSSGGPLGQPGRVPDEQAKLEVLRTQIAALPSDILAAEARAAAAKAGRAAAESEWRSDRRSKASEKIAELAGQRSNVAAADDRLKRTEVRTPIEGVIQSLPIHVGEVVSQGGMVASVVPTGSGLLVEARVKPQDIREIDEGLKAKVSLSAFEVNRFGRIEGAVTHVSIDTEKSEDGDVRKEKSYIVKVRTNATAIGGREIRPGMLASVSILTGTRTVFDYVAGPISDRFKSALTER